MSLGSPAGPSRFPPIERSLRLGAGLILFSFATSHFLNHACGILRLDAMEAVRLALIWPWRTFVGQTLLYGSFLVHGSLGLYAIVRRRHLRIPKGELLQILLGLSIPPLIIIHATNVRFGHFLFGLEESYPRILYRYWILSPGVGLSRQFILLLVLWLHGCIGLNSWLRYREWYQKCLPALVAAAVLIPVLAVVGMADAGRDIDAHLAQDPGFLARVNVQTPEQSARLGAIGEKLILIYLGLVGAVFALHGAREWHERRFRAVAISYPLGREAIVPRGFSILEASRWTGIEHMSMCGGRGRCSTCRVLVTDGLERLPAPNLAERKTLAWIGAYEGVRLACQVRPRENIGVVPLLSADGDKARLLPAPIAISEEHEIAALFVDLRNSTKLADGRLPYDALFVIDCYIAAVVQAAESNGGQVTSIAGDGLMCFFGADCDPATACRRAVFALRDLWESLAALSLEFEIAFDFPLRFGAGCHLGLAIVGTVAGRHRAQFLGEVGNIAARLEALTKELQSTIILSRAVLERAGFAAPEAESHRIQIKNVTAPIEVVAFRTPQELDELIALPPSRQRQAKP
jgi:adenylate cyclase